MLAIITYIVIIKTHTTPAVHTKLVIVYATATHQMTSRDFTN